MTYNNLHKYVLITSTPHHRLKGFSIIELVVVILLIGILAAYAFPNLNLDGFRAQGFEQQATAAIRYGQKQAIATGCNIDVSISLADCTVQYGAPVETGCAAATTSFFNPATTLNNFCNNSMPDSGAVLPASVQFDRIGRPSGSLSINFGTATITIEPETGFAYE